jgi:hemoglobin-like flavoprotein
MDTFYCRECGNVKRGWKVPDDNSVIRLFASEIGLVDAAGQPTAVGNALVLDFYGRLLSAAPYLAQKFPADLLDANASLNGRGAKQRDKLLAAVLAVMTMFNPGDDQRMSRLTQTLEAMALRHAQHRATIEEYGAVVSVLLSVLQDFARTSNVPESIWESAYEPALRRALTFASGRMMAAESLGLAEDSEPITEVIELPQQQQPEQQQSDEQPVAAARHEQG